METRKIKKDMILFSPGKPGRLFTYIANHRLSSRTLRQTIELLEYENKIPVRWIFERRTKQRAQDPLYAS